MKLAMGVGAGENLNEIHKESFRACSTIPYP